MPIQLYKAHPWHGIPSGPDVPAVVNVYVEIVPTDSVKYEVDKESGYLKIDRPQRYSNQCPTLYGFIPRTYCGKQVGALCSQKTGRPGVIGDGDPLDICVLTERPILHGDIILQAVPIGGLLMIDKNQADDKIISVLKNDLLYGNWKDIADCEITLLDRLRHYFLTYKNIPGETKASVEIPEIYDTQMAHEIIRASIRDYEDHAGELAS